MNGKEFYNIVKTEGLNKFNIGDSFEIAKVANVLGCINDNGWVVYETDERGAYHVISKHSSEEEGLEVLLNELRNKKRKEEIMKKILEKTRTCFSKLQNPHFSARYFFT